MQLWLKTLRNERLKPESLIKSDLTKPLRFFLSGEYGDLNKRPHYHAIIYNAKCEDKKVIGAELYESEALSGTWNKGRVVFGEVTAASACYVAGYAAKKLGHTQEVDADGVLKQAPFLRMSRRPGIGLPWLRTFADDIREGFVVTRDGQKMPVPRYYKKKLGTRCDVIGKKGVTTTASPLLEEIEQAIFDRMVGRGDSQRKRRPDKEKIHQRLVELQGARGL